MNIDERDMSDAFKIVLLIRVLHDLGIVGIREAQAATVGIYLGDMGK